MAHRPGLVEADGTVDAQTAPTAPWQTLRVSHELPQRTVVIQSPTKNPEEPEFGTAVTSLAFKEFESLQPTGTDVASPRGILPFTMRGAVTPTAA